MELKVWVEGIQRVVCGVNEKTTCQDVVYALAHATGKTGRFTLIERWRNSERLLAPGEQPLKVLLKWGEHSNDVQFILQWSPLDSSGTSKTTSPGKSGQSTGNGGGENLSENQGGGGGSQFILVMRPSPTQLGQVTSSTNPSSSKQFSHLNGGTVGGGRLPSSEASGVMKGAPQRLIFSDAIKEFSSSSQISSGKGNSSPGSSLQQGPPPPVGKMKELSAPPPYREPPNPITYQGKVSPSVSSPSSINSPSLKGLPPYREPPPPTMMQQQQPSPQYPNPNAYLIRHNNSSNSPVRGASNSTSGGSQSYFGSSANSSSSSLLNNGGTNSCSVSASGVPSSKESPRHAPQVSPSSHDAFSASSFNNASDKSDNSFWNSKESQPLINGDTPNQNGSVNKTSTVSSSVDSPNSHYKELVRLVNSQREKLTSQQAELTQYDAEIMFWEGKAKEQQRNMEFITKEISRLELISSQNEGQVLSLVHLEEENDYVRQESETLKAELTSLKGDLGKCENELDKCRNRLRYLFSDPQIPKRLMEELHNSQTAVAQRQEEWMQREAATLAEVDRLKKELEMARRETDAVSDLSGSLDKEVHSLDSNLAEKKKQMEQLVSAMKEANLQSLIINPPEELVDGGVHQRSGSTRRMIGSPRQLENAAPTSKNPHGVWV
ncbi:Ras association domain-containing protein 8 [Orchesella cincta]|uniref:Ras association domain-containing protein 8 n=1 Tax=Orchesella cincta TaxID=48709 RepID=A0A1D2M727_ORCCI|nr:Ras association domain-containing protein 8 [Orchesella cincta]